MVLSLKAEVRDGSTKHAVKQLRSSGKVPGVVYGKKVGSTTIAVEAKELLMLLRSNPHAIVEMDLPQGGKQPVMIHEVQRDKITRNLLHIDFHQINMDEPVRTSVTLELVGEPKGEQEGGMLQVQMHEVEIRCLPALIPGAIRYDISAMELGDTVLVRDLVMPEGIELKSHAEDVVATLLAPQKEAEEPDEAAAQAEAKGKPAAEAVQQTAETVS
ncbi:50S ribosomal protein L25 [Gorillibacterium sp. sgz5001074]|uniref:50S ribosomal protein L25 n=1 Tax=Gorillibacterium sp. sgz5001074 TaxID=3446695 RepID=UPI003F66489C